MFASDSKLEVDSAATHPNGKDFLQAFLVGLSKPHESTGQAILAFKLSKRELIYYGKCWG
jgi:hypothetical protein